MFFPLIFDERRLLCEPGSLALRTRRERDGPLHERADVRLHRVDILGQHRLLDLGDQTLVGQVDALHLDLGRLRVEQLVEFLLGELRDRLVHVEAGAGEDASVPAVHAVARNLERAPTERQAVVVQRGQIEVADRAHALAAWAHAAHVDHVAYDVLLDPAAALLGAHHPARRPRRNVEREGRWRADVRLPEPAEEDAQHRAGVGGGADGGARVGTHPLLVHDDRRGQAVESVHLGPRQRRHETLHKGAVGLVDQPLRLRGDRVEHQRALARAGDAREHRQLTFRDLDRHVLEVVHACAVHADQIVTAGTGPLSLRGARHGGLAHCVSPRVIRAGRKP